MEQSLALQKSIEDLARDNVEIRQQYREIARWFPSVQRMRNHARGLVKVMTDDEKLRSFPMASTSQPPLSSCGALVNTISDYLNLFVLGPNDKSNDEASDKFIVLSGDEAKAEVEMVGSVVAVVEWDKEIPIDVEKLPDIADLEEAVVVKKEVQNEEELLAA
ncbi:hypothetical protein ZWY2020_043541 [Hordeum vulgare]|nr:hypothetical protein ZWY2020_043541 [Hordeum vulgare]